MAVASDAARLYPPRPAAGARRGTLRTGLGTWVSQAEEQGEQEEQEGQLRGLVRGKTSVRLAGSDALYSARSSRRRPGPGAMRRAGLTPAGQAPPRTPRRRYLSQICQMPNYRS